MPRKMNELTPKYIKLVDLWFGEANFDKTKAATLAGFSKPNKYAGRLFRHPAVAAEVERRHEENRERINITEDKILQELAKIGFSSLGDLIEVVGSEGTIDMSKLTKRQRAAISEFTTEVYQEGRGEAARDVKRTKIKFHDKKAALELLGKHLGTFVEKLEVSGGLSLVERLNKGRKRTGK